MIWPKKIDDIFEHTWLRTVDFEWLLHEPSAEEGRLASGSCGCYAKLTTDIVAAKSNGDALRLDGSFIQHGPNPEHRFLLPDSSDPFAQLPEWLDRLHQRDPDTKKRRLERAELARREPR